MNFIRIGLRGLRRDWRVGDLRVMAVALIIATASVVSVASFSDRLLQALRGQGSELLGADLAVRSPYPPRAEWSDAARQYQLNTTTTAEFRTIVVANEQTQLVELKAVAEQYPLRGRVRLTDTAYSTQDAPAEGIPSPGTVWVDAQLLSRLGVSAGGSLSIGTVDFVVDKIITLEPDRGGVAFTLAPRVMMNMRDLPETGLIQPGSLVRYRLLVAGREDQVPAFRTWLLAQGVAESDLQQPDNAQPRFRIALDRGQRFLQLATLVSVLLAGIAIARSAQHYAQTQWDNAAIMRCFGASQGEITAIYLSKLLGLACFASLAGTGIGYIGQQILVHLLPGLIGGELPPPSWRPMILGLTVGVVTVLGFGLPPIMRLRDVPPLRVIRRELGILPTRGWVVYGVAVLSIALITFWIARDPILSLWVLGGTLVTVLLLTLITAILLRILNYRTTNIGFSWRFGLSNLIRRTASSTSQIVSIGIGVMAMLLLTTVRSDLWEQWQTSLPDSTPNHFLINIQHDQAGAVADFFSERNIAPLTLTPIVRARLVSINGGPINPDNFKQEFAKRMVQRAANLSWTEELFEDNKLVAGNWWSSTELDQGLLSVEQEYARALGLKLDDVLVYRVAEREVEVKVANLRAVEWDSFRPNFFLLVPPRLLDGFSASYITSLYLPDAAGPILTGLIKRFPNVTDIDVDALLKQVRRVLDRVNQALQFIFLFAIASGLVVLWSALSTSRFERRKEIAVLRALGAPARQIKIGLMVEYAILGFCAGIVGALAAAGVGYGFARFLFEIEYHGSLLWWCLGVLLTMLVVVAAGLLSTRSDIRTPPWQSLREAA